MYTGEDAGRRANRCPQSHLHHLPAEIIHPARVRQHLIYSLCYPVGLCRRKEAGLQAPAGAFEQTVVEAEKKELLNIASKSRSSYHESNSLANQAHVAVNRTLWSANRSLILWIELHHQQIDPSSHNYLKKHLAAACVALIWHCAAVLREASGFVTTMTRSGSRLGLVVGGMDTTSRTERGAEMPRRGTG
jgi:hypothetical protein